MKFKIEKIRESELQIDKLVSQEKKMRRDFLADGTIDKNEQQKLDGVDAKISKLKGAVAKARAAIEAARRAWEARGSDYTRFKADVEELATWGHADHPNVQAESDKISPLTVDQQWSEATIQLDAALKVRNPAMEDYHKQVDAKAEYDPLRIDTDTRLSRAAAADPFTFDIETKHMGLTAQLDVIDKSIGTKDYVTSLTTLKGTELELASLEELIKEVRQKKANYDKEMAAFDPSLKEAQGCVVETLVKKQADLEADAGQIKEAVDLHDYTLAQSKIAELAVRVGLYMAEYATLVDAQTLYEASLPRIEGDLANMRECRFPDLSTQQQKILDVDVEMRSMAGAGSFQQAVEELNKLAPLIDTFKKNEERARLSENFEAKVATLTTRMAKVLVCNYLPLEDFQGKISAEHGAAVKAASENRHADGLTLLGDVEIALGDFEIKLVAQEDAQTEYEDAIDQITSRFQDASSCAYPQLSEQAFDLIESHNRMAAAATGRDFVAAATALGALDREIGIFETTMEELEAKQTEYETRQPPLVQRFDSLMVSDFAQLEDERDLLQTGRADMESAAGNRDFPLAVDHLSAVERMLNDLDAQAGNLTTQKQQYEAILALIGPGLTLFDACDHEELTVKKTPILKVRADMLALAIEEDFGVALERANSLILPLLKFAILEAQVVEYRRLLGVINPRLETIKNLKPQYKSLKKHEETIDLLFDEMAAQAAKAELTDALKKMKELETLVTAIIKLHDEMRLKQEAYKTLLNYMQDDITRIQTNKIIQDDVVKAKEAADTSWTKFKGLAGKDEYFLAVTQGNVVKTKIKAFFKAVDDHGKAEDVFEMLRERAEEHFQQAEAKAKDYEELKAEFKKLELSKKHEAMDKAGSDDSPDYDVAKAKAQALLNELEKFDNKAGEVGEREAAVAAAADIAIARFGKVAAKAKAAAEKVEDDFNYAKEAHDDLTKALSGKKLAQAERKVSELNEALDRVEGVLKTKEEHKADYDALLGALQAKVNDAKVSPFISELDDEFKLVEAGLKAMTDRAVAEDYRGGVDAAPKVTTELTAFDVAEDKLEQINAVLIERIGEIDKDMPKLKENKSLDLISKIAVLNTDYALMTKEIDDNRLTDADKSSRDIRDRLREMLAKIEEIEDAETEEDEEDSDSFFDDVVDVVDSAIDYGIDKVKEHAPEEMVVVYDTVVAVADDLEKGNYGDAVYDVGKGVAKVHPVTKKVVKTLEAIEEAAGVVEDGIDFIKKD